MSAPPDSSADPSGPPRTPERPSPDQVEPVGPGAVTTPLPTRRGPRRGRLGLALGGILLVGAGWWWSTQKSPAELLATGWQQLEEGNMQSAWQTLRVLRRQGTAPPEAGLLAAAILVRKGQLAEALPLLKKPGEYAPTTAQAFTLMAECYAQLGQPADGVRAAQEALRHAPESLAAHRWLAIAAYDLGAVDLAAESLRKLSRGEPTNPRPDRLLGLIEKDSGHPELAIRHYRESLQRLPGPADCQQVWTELAECLLDTQQPEAALEVLARAEPTVEVELLRGRGYAGLGETQAEAAALERSRNLDSQSLAVLLAGARFALREGDVKQALTWARAAVLGHPHDSAAHYVCGQAWERAGDPVAAQREFDLFQQWREREERFATLHAEASREVENPELRVELGELAEVLRKPELALTWYRAALSLNPKLTVARQALERLEKQSGQPPNR